jgi:hypothetical protein
MFTTGCVVSASTTFRVGVGWLELWSEAVPKLMQIGFNSWDNKDDARRAQGEFRDELIAFARGSSEVALSELRRGVADLDAFTRPKGDETARPTRPYKAKR